MLKRSLFVFLLISVLFSACSCLVVVNGSDKPKTTESAETKSKLATPDYVEFEDKIISSLEDGKAKATEAMSEFSGEEYSNIPITLTCCTGSDLFIVGENGTPAQTLAVQFRNELVASTINTELIVQEREFGVMLNEAKSAKASELYYSDLVCIRQGDLKNFIDSGLLLNLKSLFISDFSQDYMNPVAVNQFSVDGYSYAVAGNALADPDSMYCIYFNKDIVSDYFDLYSVVKDGDWTYEKMISVITEIVANEEGVYGLGLGCDTSVFSKMLFASSGLTYTDACYGKTPDIVYDEERINAVADYGTRLLKKKGNMYIGAKKDSQVLSDFENGKIIFYIDKLSNASGITNNYGILPMPKYQSGTSGYYTYTDENAPVLCVLNSTNNFERIGTLFKAVNAASTQVLVDGMCRDFLDKNARDYESSEMLEIIIKGATYDFANVFGPYYPAIADATYKSFNSAVVNGQKASVIIESNIAAFNETIYEVFASKW